MAPIFFLLWSLTMPLSIHKHSRSLGNNPVLPFKHSESQLPPRKYCTKRCCRVVLAFLATLWAFVLLYPRQLAAQDWIQLREAEDNSTTRLPPLYESYHDYERHLPQHDLSLSFPEGRDAKFFWAANHVHGA